MRLLANRFLRYIPGIADYLVRWTCLVAPAPLGGTLSPCGSHALARARRMSRVFPAGEVAHHATQRRRASTRHGDTTAAELAVRTRRGCRSALYWRTQTAACFKRPAAFIRSLRTALLPREIWAKRGSTIPVRHRSVGCATMEVAALLRSRVARHPGAAAHGWRHPPRHAGRCTRPRRRDRCRHRGDRIRLLIDSGVFQVFCASASDLPAILPSSAVFARSPSGMSVKEQARPASSIASTTSIEHLFVWDRSHQRLLAPIGSARPTCARTVEISTRNALRLRHSPALRSGPHSNSDARSSSLDYQRDFSPLLLLWKGVSRLVSQSSPDIVGCLVS